MKIILDFLKKYLSPLFNTRAAGLYILCFAISIAVATFIENDFGTSSSQKVVYKTWWFTALLALFAVTIIVNIFRFRMIQQKKWALLMFHLAMIIILLGSAVTRYFGYEGVMHIRENDASNSFLSSETYLQFNVFKDEQSYAFDEPVLFATLGNNHWKESYLVGKDLIEVEVIDFIPNPIQVLDADASGLPTIKIVMGGMDGREEYFVRQGETYRIRDAIFNFRDEQIPEAINIAYRNDSLLIKTSKVLMQTVMATQKRDTLYPTSGYHPLMLRSLYTDGVSSFVFGDFNAKGAVRIDSEGPKVKSESMTALKAKVSVNGVADTLYIYGAKGLHGSPSTTELDGLGLSIAYGAKHIALPFSLKLYDFIMERYPGTNSAVSYASEVQLIDTRKNLEEDHRIYMNHILNYEGYRFFQSSFDNDELGTYLSVNHDFWGSWISYLGYTLLTLGMIMTLLSRKSRFYQVSQNIKKLRLKSAASLVFVALLLSIPTITSAQKIIDQGNFQNIVDADHARAFSRLIVQDHNGRMKPIHTLTREVMRKLARKESLNGLNADQIILGMFVNSRDWIGVPMISLGQHEAIHKLLGVSEKMASYKDFFAQNGEYLLNDEVSVAYSLQPVDRGVYEKELMKIDERVNIANMVYSGTLFKMVPVPDDPNNTWAAVQVSGHNHGEPNTPLATKFFESYKSALAEAMVTNDYRLAGKMLSELASYQKSKGGALMPSPSEIKAEILLNKLNIFNRLAVLYSLLGVAFLFFLFFSVFRPDTKLSTVHKVLLGLVIASFVFHTIGLGMRWYVSGRAPWSNGYESMIYIAWTTLLAGVIFARKSFGGLAATMTLSATVLLVASLSYLDPEITPLVPVLRSYWLTIHVSMEAGSYGFLMLGAIIGLINLILMVFLTTRNKDKIHHQIREMSYLSEMTLIGGLFMISIGTYLGGVWANESWGRYWGWDAKETWALVTILVYAFILHMRIIPKMQGLFAYNFATIFGLGSVVMTYYGVNYYLSGLHSYAAGDPVPIPQWVYIVITSILIISILAFWKKRMHNITT
ncbi:MAG: cytochrome c biogenesis protein CcsA [Cyclobacteriaceae bacterium]|nr:cytochrome c biogenesis protein CcsA [Cyclobacteriaceae bacterium]